MTYNCDFITHYNIIGKDGKKNHEAFDLCCEQTRSHFGRDNSQKWVQCSLHKHLACSRQSH